MAFAEAELTAGPTTYTKGFHVISRIWGRINSLQEPDADRIYPNFNIMRLMLAVSVVFTHCWGDLLGRENPYVPYAAVPAFLAISGFVVLASFERSKNCRQFAFKRLLRVGPAFVLALVLAGIVVGMKGVEASLATWATLGIGTLGSAGDAPLWSLSWEEICYVLLAALSLAGGYRRAGVSWMLLILSIVAALTIPGRDHALLCRVLPVMPAFFVGNLCYLYRVTLRSVRPIIPSFCFVLSTVSLLYVTPDVRLTILQCIVGAFTVVWFCIGGPKIPSRLPGDYSYGLYVYHYLMVHLAWNIGLNYRYPGVAFVFATSTVLAMLSWHLVESKFLALKNRPLAQNTSEKPEVLATASTGAQE